jgi:hypothetical protein
MNKSKKKGYLCIANTALSNLLTNLVNYNTIELESSFDLMIGNENSNLFFVRAMFAGSVKNKLYATCCPPAKLNV